MQLLEGLFALSKIAVPAMTAAYFLVSPLVAMSFWNRFVFFPTTGDHEYYQLVSLQSVPRRDVSISTSNDAHLHGWLFAAPNARRIAIINHGNGGSIIHRVPLIEALLKCGVSVLAYDYQGYGKSTGKPSVPNIVADGVAAYDYANTTLGYQPENIILVGESLGCGVSTEVALKRSCSALILQSGFKSLPLIAREKMPLLKIFPNALFPQPLLSNVSNLPKIKVPVLVIHGTNDQTIPCAHSQASYAAANEPKTLRLIDGAGHNDCFIVGGPEIDEALRVFIKTLDAPAKIAG